jgi:hypothetical protein
MGPAPLPPQKPKKDGASAAIIALIALIGLGVFGLGGCLVCLYVGGKGASDTPTASTSEGPDPATPSGKDVVITSERPFVQFIAPSGWDRALKGDWGLFRAPDGQAVFAFTTFNQPNESTARLSQAAFALGVSDIQWGSPQFGTIGRDNFKARMGEGSCNFSGPGGYIWYATVDGGTSDQMLLIYTVSARGDRSHKEAALRSIKSLQRRN